MRAIIIDDEQLNIELIEVFSQRYAPTIEVIGTADCVEDAIHEVINKKPDLLFLDVELNNQTGFDILEAVNQPNLMVIMTTAYEKYALKALKFNVVDYLLKPISIKEFVKAVEKCKILDEKNKRSELTESSHTDTKFISIPYKNQSQMLPIDHILRLEAKGNYSVITMVNNEKHMVGKALHQYEEKLPSHIFLRTHNSHIINISFISKVLRGKVASIVMNNDDLIPISDKRRKEVFERLLS